MTYVRRLRLSSIAAALGLLSGAAFVHVGDAQRVWAAEPAAQAPAPQRQLGPPAGAGDLLEGGDDTPPPQAEPEQPIVPVPPPQAKPATSGGVGGGIGGDGPAVPDRTQMLLGEIEILDIPLAEIPNYRDDMRDIVTELSNYAHTRDPNFVVVTRGGFDLLAWSRREFDLEEIKRDPLVTVPRDAIRPVGMPLRLYIQELNGIILNGQFCAPLRVPRDDLQTMAKMGLKILSIEHCKTPATAASALQAAIRGGVVAHTDPDTVDTFATVPKSRPSPENPRNVQVLGEARNMLVMLDSVGYPSRDEWLAALQATNYDVLVTDAFYKGKQSLTKNEVHALKFKEMGARRLVLARVNIGYAEDERFYWQREWRIGEPSWIQAYGPDGPGQYVVDYWNPAWKAIVGRYFAGIMDLGFDGVVLDGVEAYRRWEFRTPLDPTQAAATKPKPVPPAPIP